MKKTILISFLLFCQALYGQQFYQKRLHAFSGESANSIVNTADGGYAITGITGNSGSGTGDVFIVKFSNSGTIQWTRKIGGNDYDAGTCLIQTSDRGYAIAGRTNYWEFQMYVLKLDSVGNIQWSKQMNLGLFDQAFSLVQTTDGNLIVSGRITGSGTPSYEGVIFKLNMSGTLLWSRSIGGYDDGVYSIVQANDGTLVLAGTVGAGNSSDLLFTKIDTNGTVLWSKKVGGNGIEISGRGSKLIQTHDNGFMYAGTTNSFGNGNDDMLVVKLSASGSLQWAKAIGGSGFESGHSVVQTLQHGYVVCGTTYTTPAVDYNAYLAFLDSSGNLTGTRVYGGTGAESVNDLIQLIDGSIVFAGSTSSYNNNSDVYLVKTDSTGNSCNVSPASGVAISGGTASSFNNGTSPVALNNIDGPVNTNTGGILYTICSCAVPGAVVTASSTSICAGASTSLLTNATNGNTYQWFYNNNLITGATGSGYTANAGGTYFCVQSNACGTDTSNSIQITLHPLPAAGISSNGPITFCDGGSVILSAPFASNKAYQWLRNSIPITGATAASYTASLSGTYKVQVTHLITGCSKTTSSGTKVTVNALPAATVTPQGPISFCAGDSVVMHANNGNGLSYQWIKNGGNISGANSASFTATTAGKYKVQTTNLYGCTKKSSMVTVTVPCRTADFQHPDAYHIFPNPSATAFNIEIPGEQSLATQIRVYDPLGREVINRTEKGTKFLLDLSEMEEGIYTVLFDNGQYRVSRKLVKMRGY